MGKLNKKFATHFKEQILKRYKRIPSAGFLANEFNLRAHQFETVSREAVRKWLNGMAMPKRDKLMVMSRWLDVKVDLFHQD